jgi:hypothetical protein
MPTDQQLRADLSDEEFLARFEAHDLPGFSHVDHIRMATRSTRDDDRRWARIVEPDLAPLP